MNNPEPTGAPRPREAFDVVRHGMRLFGAILLSTGAGWAAQLAFRANFPSTGVGWLDELCAALPILLVAGSCWWISASRGLLNVLLNVFLANGVLVLGTIAWTLLRHHDLRSAAWTSLGALATLAALALLMRQDARASRVDPSGSRR